MLYVLFSFALITTVSTTYAAEVKPDCTEFLASEAGAALRAGARGADTLLEVLARDFAQVAKAGGGVALFERARAAMEVAPSFASLIIEMYLAYADLEFEERLLAISLLKTAETKPYSLDLLRIAVVKGTRFDISPVEYISAIRSFETMDGRLEMIGSTPTQFFQNMGRRNLELLVVSEHSDKVLRGEYQLDRILEMLSRRPDDANFQFALFGQLRAEDITKMIPANAADLYAALEELRNDQRLRLSSLKANLALLQNQAQEPQVIGRSAEVVPPIKGSLVEWLRSKFGI